MAGDEKDEIKSRYAGKDFYEVFGVEKEAPLREIQRAYRILALKVHPDRNNNSRESTRDFQELSRMMEILGDPARRASYDLLGDQKSNDERSSTDWKDVFRRVTEEDIDAYAEKYIGSQEEIDDVLHAYHQFQGNFSNMLKWIPLSDPDHLTRYDQMVRSVKAPFYPQWKDATKKANQYKKKYENEAKEALKLKHKLATKYQPFLHEKDNKDDGKLIVQSVRDALIAPSLAAGMRAREIARHKAMVQSMEQRFRKRRQTDSLPSEEEFLRIQRRLDTHRSKKRSKRSTH